MVVPTALPAGPIGLEQPVPLSRKRKTSELAHFIRERSASFEPNNQPAANGTSLAAEADPAPPDDGEETSALVAIDIGGSHSVLEDLLDQIDTFPYEPPLPSESSSNPSMDKARCQQLRDELKQNGIEEFFRRTVDHGMDVRELGIAFGINPNTQIDDDVFLRLLGLAVVRAFHRREKLPQHNTLEDAAELLKKSSKVMVITGAGISTSLGIPDFRSKHTGFYDKIRQMDRDDISEPQDVFDIYNFDFDPQLFYDFACEILPDRSRGYTPTHGFIRLLDQMGKLQTNYTQNIDNLEGIAGISSERVVQCHGSFKTATCRKCKTTVDGSEIEAEIRMKQIPRCKSCIQHLRHAKPARKPPKSSKSRFSSADSDEDDDMPEPGVMKPDITFFGEQLPDDFFDRFMHVDSKHADLVVVIGTSLQVAPVSEMPNHVPHHVPHIFISMEPIRHVDMDIQLIGKCDEIVAALCQRAGWTLEHDWLAAGAEHFEATRAEDAPSHVWTVRPVAPATTLLPAVADAGAIGLARGS